ncbi:hypothetical protein DAEQUDRAFT_663544 [Daedalea quercina L-15889]|uniref:Lethal giant larvae (Lgl)-like C-terminal domain-containing protein n=1 Tax=Daedalea quercina L-15889 TaxID=1314783 RepID=A0A165T385_9APHY|nr:hypothetical protein DAEQUDRAFT_663544 [Daedalea quercina L-15889]
MSPYAIPSDAWAQYEEKVQMSGMPVIHTPGSGQIVDVVIHPRDLNLLFVAYGGGIILTDLDILLPRRPAVAALTVHPSGHVLAVGHADGTIAFWALEDEDHPLYLRTLDEEDDVFAVDVTKLEASLSSNDKSGATERRAEIREPIFKLAWSGFPNSNDPRGGDTVLTILGGLTPDSPQGLTTFLLPPLNPPAPPDAATSKMPSQSSLHPDVRTDMQGSLFPLDSHTYHMPSAVQDFLVIPRTSPHFSGTWDPHAILLLSDSAQDPAGGTRVLDAYEFPPPAFIASLMVPSTPGAEDMNDPSAALGQELATTLESMALSSDPRQLRMPWAFWTVAGSTLFKVDKEAYRRLKEETVDDALAMKGGKAWVDDTEGQMKLMKFQPHHILATHDHELVIRFQDLSAQLLTSSFDSPMKSSFPNALPALTIELGPLLHDPSLRLSALPSSAASIRSAHDIHTADHGPTAVHSIYLAPESLECVAVMNHGTVVLSRLDAQDATTSPSDIADEELISLTHIPVRSKSRYRPFLGIRAGWGPVSACAMSDVDSAPRIRLIATSSGSASIYTLSRSSSGTFTIPDPPVLVDAASHPLPYGSFVIDAKSGARVTADRQGLSAVIEADSAQDAGRRVVWVSAGTRGARCVANVDGDKLGKVDWPGKMGTVVAVDVVEKNGGCALVTFTDRGEALVYSLPFLEHMHTLQLPQTSLSHISADSTGDYLTHVIDPITRIVHQTIYGTLFATRRVAPYTAPLVDFMTGHGSIPSQPAPVLLEPQTVIGSVLGYLGRGVTTGAEIDTLLAGPDRPEPPKSIYDPTGRVPPASHDAMAKGKDSGAGASSVKAASAQMSSGVSDLYNRLGSALAERGEMLGNLEEQFNSLEQGSKSMVEQEAEEAVLARSLAFMIPLLGVAGHQLIVWIHVCHDVPSVYCMWWGRGIMYLRGRAIRITEVRDILVHEDRALRDRWRVLKDSELLHICPGEDLTQRSISGMARRITDFDESVELSPDGLQAFRNADGVVEDGVLGVNLVCFLDA